MSEASSKKKRFAEAARLVAIHLSKQQGRPLSLPGLAQTSSGGPSEIIPSLYLGDYWDASDEAQLRALHVTHILSVMENSPPLSFASEFRASLKTLHIPIRDSFMTNILKYLDQTTKFILKALKDASSVVLVHCFQGVSRSATVVAAYLLATSTEFDSAVSVLRFLKEKRSVVSPNFAFVSQLDDYAALCLERRRSKPR